ncbi:AsmA family protein [Nitrosovibrio sp. Nv17]|uniref:AsmA family protein n=1 Tax=Nitrosovibrio sp. Nv17 TaxID=1855339 RepID=UPI000908CE01|nr:AsmA family protein [Nitrosovibrio sp. Nv17]SFW16331.1 hypothetical protein SAMN05216414_103124 [Nitrosovibrio sp. Nv17]
MQAQSRKILTALVMILGITTMAVIATFDWNILKPYIERQVGRSTGRSFRIGGNLEVSPSLIPRIQVEDLSFGNAEWGIDRPMLTIRRLSFRIDLWKLLGGSIVLPEVSISRPDILLEKSRTGEPNWIFGEEKETKPPQIGRLTLDHGMLAFLDPVSDTAITAQVSPHAPSADARATPIHVKAEGVFKGLEFLADVQGGEVVSMSDAGMPYPIAGNVRIGSTHARFDGTLTGLQSLSAADIDLTLEGNDLAALYPIVGVVIFPSPPYRVEGRLVHHGTEWALKDFAGRVGNSDLAGDMSFETGGPRPRLSGNVSSRMLDLQDLSGFVGARRGAQPEDDPAEKKAKKASLEAQRHRVLPDKTFSVERLQAMDADVRFRGESIRNRNLPVERLASHTRVQAGVMKLDADFGVAEGHIDAQVEVDSNASPPRAEARVEVRRLSLPRLFPENDLIRDSRGLIGGRARLASAGRSVGELLGSADGHFGLIMSGGRISNMLLEIAGLDGAEMLKFLVIGDRNVELRCAVADFAITKGTMKSEAFVIDTADTNILGEGEIDLAEETLKMKFSPEPKDVSISALRTPVHLAGTFKEPKVYPDKMLALRAGAAVLLGVFATPLAALIPLIETGPGEDHDCKSLTGSMKQSPPSKEKGAARAGESTSAASLSPGGSMGRNTGPGK